MAQPDFTPAEIHALLIIDAGEAKAHARCGDKAKCRRDAIAKCDEDLDAMLAIPARPMVYKRG